MKKIFLLLAFCFVSIPSFGQNPDPELFKTWYLTEITADLGPSDFVSDITPRISPTLTINEDLTYFGDGACNGFGGFYTHDTQFDMLIAGEFIHTLQVCDFESHDGFESLYFSYLSYSDAISYFVSPTSLVLETSPGFELIYQNEPLSINDNRVFNFSIYPNPTTNQLFITSDNTTINSYNIYSISGKLMSSNLYMENTIDVSVLPSGMYFLEVSSESGKAVKQFIKQ